MIGRIYKVIKYTNGLVNAYDDDGKLVIEGTYRDVRGRILKRCDENTLFEKCDWAKRQTKTIRLEEF